jgi:hypothetical protein
VEESRSGPVLGWPLGTYTLLYVIVGADDAPRRCNGCMGEVDFIKGPFCSWFAAEGNASLEPSADSSRGEGAEGYKRTYTIKKAINTRRVHMHRVVCGVHRDIPVRTRAV